MSDDDSHELLRGMEFLQKMQTFTYTPPASTQLSTPTTQLPPLIRQKRPKLVKPPCPQCCTPNPKLLGGGKRGVDYGFHCKVCKFTWNEGRDANLSGQRVIKASKRAVLPTDTKRCVYKCSQCGQPKLGHVCKFADMVSTPKKTAVLSKKIEPDVKVSPLSVITSALAKQMDGNSDEEEDTEEECEWDEEEEDWEDEAEESESEDEDDDDERENDDEVEDDDEEQEEQEEEQEGEQEEDGQEQGGQEQEEEEETEETEEEEEEEESGEKEAEQKTGQGVGEEDEEERDDGGDDVRCETGDDVYACLQLLRYLVCGDGSCWVYALLAVFGLCEHMNTRVERKPSPMDRGMDAVCRCAAQERITLKNGYSASEVTFAATLMILPKHPRRVNSDFGTFGNMTSIRALAQFFGVSVVVFNATTLSVPGALQQVIEYVSDDCVKERFWSPQQIYEYALTGSLACIEWNGSDHYAALKGPSKLSCKPEVRDLLLAAVPNTERNPQPTSKSMWARTPQTPRLPAGWVLYKQKARMDPDKSRSEFIDSVQGTIAKQLDDAEKSGHNALIDFKNGTAFKAYYPFALTLSGCCDVVGDNAMDLYVYKPGMPKAKPPVHDGSCFCNKFMDMTKCAFIRCNGCRRECHVQCAFSGAKNMSDDEIDRWVDDNEKSYQCPKCQPQKGKKRRAAGM